MKRLLLSAVILASPAGAATPRPGFSGLVADSDLIVAGTVTNVVGVWNKDRNGIFSFITLSDLDVIDGEYAGKTFVLREDGGVVRGFLRRRKRQVVVGVPQFLPGERVLLFIAGNGEAICPIVGWEAGALSVKKDAEGKLRVYDRAHGLELAGVENNAFVFKVKPGPQPTVTESNPETRELWLKLVAERQARVDEVLKRDFTYEDLKGLIRKYAAEVRKPRREARSAALNAALPTRRFPVVAPKLQEKGR